jgi:hypothetical protein
VSNRYLVGAYAIGALPVGKVVTRPAPRAAPKPASSAPVATRPAPPAAPKPTTKPAPPAKPTTSPATKSKITAAANHAATTAGKLARRHPGMSGALKRISSAMSSKAQSIKGDDGLIDNVIGWFIGDDSADAQQATGADIAAQAGDIAVQIYNTLDALSAAGKTDLMHEGEALVNSCNYIVITIDQMIRSNSAM